MLQNRESRVGHVKVLSLFLYLATCMLIVGTKSESQASIITSLSRR